MPDLVELDFDFQCQPLFVSGDSGLAQIGFLYVDPFRPPDGEVLAAIDKSINIGRWIRCLHSSLII